ncbi:MAG: hypothetical protein ABIG89_04515 [Candidatus Woesearchaeota archaeon]
MEFETEESRFESYQEPEDKECIYSESGSATLLDDDELTPEEEAFMRGYIEE